MSDKFYKQTKELESISFIPSEWQNNSSVVYGEIDVNIDSEYAKELGLEEIKKPRIFSEIKPQIVKTIGKNLK